MAIILISPKKNQRIFFWAITTLLILFVFAVSLIIFPPGFRQEEELPPLAAVPGAASIKINFNIIDSQQVKGLDAFEPIQSEFSYVGKDKDGKEISGTLMAVSRDEAASKILAMGLQLSILEEKGIGRSEPFTSYYRGAAGSGAGL